VGEYNPFSRADATQLWKNPSASNSSFVFIPQQNSVLIIENERIVEIAPPLGQVLFGQLVSASDTGEVFITSDSTSGSSVFGKGQVLVYKTDATGTWSLSQTIEFRINEHVLFPPG
jgi:hypothetical protein